MSIEQVEQMLTTSATGGLRSKETRQRLIAHGPNALPRDHSARTRWHIFLNQWKSPLLYLLLIAAGISVWLQQYVDAIVVAGTALINAAVGFFQEDKASRALAELSEYAPNYSQVYRDRQWVEVLGSEIVPGDLLLLQEGDGVPADGRIVQEHDFVVREAALTGESQPVNKHTKTLTKSTSLGDQKNMVFAGSTVERGSAHVLVTATGSKTELGRIALLVDRTQETITPLQEQIKKIGHMIMALVAVLATLIFAVGIFQGRTPNEIFLVAVAVGVAAIPEGLAVTLTVILAIGMRRMLARQALTRRLIAAETLGSVSVMCVDKTGTITQGRMTVTETVFSEVVFGEKKSVSTEEHFYRSLVLCTEAQMLREPKIKDISYRGESTEVALLQAAARENYFKDELSVLFPRIDSIAFDHAARYMATLHQGKTKNLVFVKGALASVLSRCTSRAAGSKDRILSDADRSHLVLSEEQMTKKGLRVLAVAFANVPKKTTRLPDKGPTDLTFLGFVALEDPIRNGIPDVIEKARVAGVRTILITGDHLFTAKSVAQTIGLAVEKDGVCFTGQDFELMTEKERGQAVARACVFARVEPRHKLLIVQALQKRGEVVAMTGDGVNDAPAIKAADIGIALGSGTAVAKDVADVVLLDDAMNTIVAAIEQGRIMFENVRKVVLYLFSNMFTEVLLVTCSLVLFLPLPLSAVQILWINLVTDVFPAMALAFDPGHAQLMTTPPRRRDTPILNGEMKTIIFAVSLVADFILFAFYVSIQSSNLDHAYMRTIMFLATGLGSVVYIHAIRSMQHSVFSISFFTNIPLLLAQGAGVALLLAAIYVPFLQRILGTTSVAPIEWVMILLLALLKLVAIEVAKRLFVRKRYVH